MRIILECDELPPERRPQDPGLDLKFETLEHGGDYSDAMPQAIRVTDAEGRSCLYFPARLEGKVINGRLARDGVLRAPRITPSSAFREIMKIAELTADPARLPEMSDGAAAAVNQFKADVGKLGTEAANQQLQSLRRKLEGALTSPPPTTIKRIIIREALEVLGPEHGPKEKPRR